MSFLIKKIITICFILLFLIVSHPVEASLGSKITGFFDKMGSLFSSIISIIVDPQPTLAPVVINRTTINQETTSTEPELVIENRIIEKQIRSVVTEVTNLIDTTETTNNLQNQINNLESELKILASISSPAPVYYNAPTSFSSSGIQVSGHALLSTLNVSGSGSVGGSFDIHDNAAFGNTKDTKTTFDVYSDATFHEAASFDEGLTVGDDLTVNGNVNISSSAASYKIQGSDITSGPVTIIIAASESTNKNRANYVCDGTSDEVEIQQAIDSLTNGGTIRLLEGTFTFSDSVILDDDDSKITIEGSGPGITTINGALTDAVPYFDFNVSLGETISHLKISNFTLDASDHTDSTVYDSSLIRDKSSGSINYLEISHLKIITDGWYDHAIAIYNDDYGLNQHVRIFSNTITKTNGVSFYGILIRKTTYYLWIENNDIYISNDKSNQAYNAIAVYADSKYFHVNNNTTEVQGMGHTPIAISSASEGEVTGNYVIAPYYPNALSEGGIEVESKSGHGTTTSSNIVVANNVVKSNIGDNAMGIYVRHLNASTIEPYNITITDNLIVDCDIGIRVSDGINVSVHGNTFQNCAQDFSKTATATINSFHSAGSMGIGTTTPYSRLSVWGDGTNPIFEAVDNASSTKLTILNNGNVGIGITNPAGKLHVIGTAGNDTGTWANLGASDERLKKDISQIDNALEQLSQLKGVTYNWINPQDHNNRTSLQTGFIAQNIEEYFPEWTIELEPWGKDKELITEGEKIKSYGLGPEFNALVLEAIKELNTKVESIDIRDISNVDPLASNSFNVLLSWLTDKAVEVREFIANVIKADRIETEEFCIGNTCVNESQFKDLLDSAGIISIQEPELQSMPEIIEPETEEVIEEEVVTEHETE